ncbi:MAG TPA: FHA domain-containing protein [Polyangia bacterium]
MSVLLGGMAKDGSPPNPQSGACPPGRLSVLIRAMAVNAEWPSLEAVILQARAAALSLPEVHDLVRAMTVTLSTLPQADRAAMAFEIESAKRQAAALLCDRVSPIPSTTNERMALQTAGAFLMEVGDFNEAAAAFERANDDGQAAKAWGAAGEIDRMELCLAREEGQARQRRGMRDQVAQFQALLAGGQRLAAMDLAASIPPEVSEAGDMRAAASDVERRLCRGRTLALRSPDGAVTHFASLPAQLGRDGFCQIVLRDPAVSRRHARLLSDPTGLSVEDAGSRAGTRLCGAQVTGRLPLPAQGQLALGEHCRLDFSTHGPALRVVTSAAGTDRGLRAFLGTGPIALALAFPSTSLLVSPGERCARIACAESVRLAGQLVGRDFDVVHGDVIEASGLRLEVV